MKSIVLIVLSAAIILVIFNLNNSDTEKGQAIYVALDGHDQNDGSKTKPFRTLDRATTEATEGTTVFIREGTYHEKLIVKHGGTKSKPVIFKPYKEEKVVISGGDLKDVEGNTSLVLVDNKNYVNISGLTIQYLTTNLTNETVMGIYVTGSSSHIILENNHIQRIETHADEGDGHGIAVYGTGEMEDINISDNILEDLKLGSSESLVLNGDVDGFKIENNIVRDSDNIGIDLIGYEGVSDSNDFVRNGVVKNNIVYNITSYGNPAYEEDYSAWGIYVDGGKNIDIEKNTIYKCDIGIEATSEHAGKYADEININNNIIYDNFYTGISIGGYDQNRGGTKNSMISQNIIYKNDTKGLEGGQILLQHDIKNSVIDRNILTAGPTSLFIANYFTTNKNNKLEKNVFHKEDEKAGIWGWKDEEYTSFTQFKVASNSDEKSSYLDPEYENEINYDFKLKKDSPAKEIVE